MKVARLIAATVIALLLAAPVAQAAPGSTFASGATATSHAAPSGKGDGRRLIDCEGYAR